MSDDSTAPVSPPGAAESTAPAVASAPRQRADARVLKNGTLIGRMRFAAGATARAIPADLARHLEQAGDVKIFNLYDA